MQSDIVSKKKYYRQPPRACIISDHTLLSLLLDWFAVVPPELQHWQQSVISKMANTAPALAYAAPRMTSVVEYAGSLHLDPYTATPITIRKASERK